MAEEQQTEPTSPLDPPAEPPAATSEADADAVAHLAAADASLRDAPPPFGSGDPLPMADPMGAPYDFAEPLAQPEPRRPAAPRDVGPPRTLDDVYARHPEIGTGDKSIIVVRKYPKRGYGGTKLDGIVGELDQRLTYQQFTDRFGGGTYELLVVGPTSVMTRDGQYDRRTLMRATIDLPGPPNLDQTPEPDVNLPRTGMTNPRTEETRLRLEHEVRMDERRRADEATKALLESSKPSTAMAHAVEQAASARAAEVRRELKYTIESHERTIDKLKGDVEKRDETIQELRHEIIETERKMAQKADEKETARVKELKDRYEADIQRIREQHTEALQRIASDNDRRMDDVTRRHSEERARADKDAKEERDRAANDRRIREEQLDRDAKLREQSLKDMYESRLREMERMNERELASVKENRDREIRTVESTTKNQLNFSDKTAQMQLDLLRGDNAKLQAVNERLERDLVHLRSRLDKTPIEAVRDARDMLGTLDMLRPEAPPEGPFDWRQAAFRTIAGVFNKETVTKLAESIGSQREQNRVTREARARAQAIAAMRQRQGYAAPQQLGQPMPMAARPPRPEPEKPVAMSRPAAEAAAEDKPAEPTAAAEPERAAEPAKVERPEPAAETERPRWGENAEAAEPAAPEPEPQQAAAPAQQPPELPTMEQIVAAIPPEVAQGLQTFAERLNDAIIADYDVGDFADQIVGEVGADTTRHIYSSLNPQALADNVAASPGGAQTAIVTPEGREYLEKLWGAVGTKLDEGGEGR